MVSMWSLQSVFRWSLVLWLLLQEDTVLRDHNVGVCLVSFPSEREDCKLSPESRQDLIPQAIGRIVPWSRSSSGEWGSSQQEAWFDVRDKARRSIRTSSRVLRNTERPQPELSGRQCLRDEVFTSTKRLSSSIPNQRRSSRQCLISIVLKPTCIFLQLRRVRCTSHRRWAAMVFAKFHGSMACYIIIERVSETPKSS